MNELHNVLHFGHCGTYYFSLLFESTTKDTTTEFAIDCSATASLTELGIMCEATDSVQTLLCQLSTSELVLPCKDTTV